MKKLYTGLIIALALSTQQAWALAYTSSEDEDEHEFIWTTREDAATSADPFDLRSQEMGVFDEDDELIHTYTQSIWTNRQNLLQFRQEGESEYFRLFAKKFVRGEFIEQNGLWVLKKDDWLGFTRSFYKLPSPKIRFTTKIYQV